MKTLLITLCLLLLGSSTAIGAGGVNVSWGDACWSDPGHTNLRNFACNTNTGSARITVSFIPSSDLPQLAGVIVYLDGQADLGTIPDWWKLYDAGTWCRDAILLNGDFTSAPNVGCQAPRGRWYDGWGMAYYRYGEEAGGPDRAQMEIVFALADPGAPVTAGTEYYAGQVIIRYVKTVGAGACAGCIQPMAWWVSMVSLYEWTGPTQDLTEAPPGGNRCLIWQNSMLCGPPVSVRNTTWGQVKSLYR
jgi:hypothetical protein